MTTYIVTTSNWNSPAFWAGIDETGPGHVLDLSALPGTYTVDADYLADRLVLSDGTTTFTVGGAGYFGGSDATLGGSTNFNFFDTLLTGDGDDSVVGTFGDESFAGGAGDDSIDASTGNDTIDAGDGNDTIDAGGDGDFVQGGGGSDSVIGQTGNDTIYGDAGDDTLEGGGGEDFLYGGEGNDSLRGGTASDYLEGGAGDDFLSGDGGIDSYGFFTGGGNDTISGFNTSSEVVDLGFSGVATYADLQPLMAASGSDTLITFGDGSTLRILGRSPGSLSASNFTFSPVCFCAGTRIRTDCGEVPVETLREGDRVLSADGALRPILWTGGSSHRFDPGEDGYKPIEIRPGALGSGRPRRTLRVSPLHHLVLRDPGGREVLVPAKSLAGLPGIRVMRGARRARYVNVLCDRHAVIVADGALAETLWPGPMALANVGPAARARIAALFPGVGQDAVSAYGPMARPRLGHRATRALFDTQHGARRDAATSVAWDICER